VNGPEEAVDRVRVRGILLDKKDDLFDLDQKLVSFRLKNFKMFIQDFSSSTYARRICIR